MINRELNAEEKAAAKRLMSVWNSKKSELKLTQEKLALACGWANQSSFAHYLHARIALNWEAVSLIAKNLKVDGAEIYPELAEKMGALSRSPDEFSAPSARILPGAEALVWDDDSPLPDDSSIAYGELHHNAKSAAGGGYLVENEDKVLFPFRRYSLEKQNVNVDTISVCFVSGDSMYPEYHDNDAIAFDRSDRRMTRGQAYVINDGGESRVKYLEEITKGVIRISSEDSDLFPHEDLSVTDFVDRITILGRVFWQARWRRR